MNEGIDDWVLIRKKSTISTNDDVAELLDKGMDKVAVISEIQTGGRGRKGNFWHSPRGGVWLSLGMHADVPAQDLVTPFVEGLAQALTQKFGTSFSVKLPNDIFLNNKKVAGILMETIIQKDRILRVVLGIGINVINEIPKELHEIATSLSQEGIEVTTDQVFDLVFKIASDFLDGLA
ncbi:MAG: biotin--[acetyl-CoA-carboxylase] ligase [Methanobacteriota archaeon]|nr:MAG: biotin--[acetyl-CoA-carboxylase] ligase [Euryarchaeota archaeon]